ncbi:MAG: D-alanine--D-alanine ligase [Candidatus Aminicenantes bacterium]|nr:D-alanine--D-alanine ligase [Candidatus Aminicenantes bacterium]
MKIGFTYDLRSVYLAMGYSDEETAEFDQESTIDAIESTLCQLGYETDRIGHVKQLVGRLHKGDRWDLVFNICEGMYGIGREAQVPALLDAYHIPYVFSSSLVMALTLDKGMTKRIIRDAGIASPDFYVVKKPEDISKVSLPFPLFSKPVAEGTGKGINPKSVVNNAVELNAVCLDLLSNFNQPVIVETFMSGREFTVGITGTGDKARSVGVMEILLKENAESDVYSYTNKEECEELIDYVVTVGEDKLKCEKLALDAFRVLGCEDGGRVDIRYDAAGSPNFLEINPLPGMHPEHSDLPILCTLNDISYPELMKMIMDSAKEKVKKH